MWRTDGRSFLGPRGMAEQPPGEESCGGRCGRTIAAQPVSDQTSPFEDAVAAANPAHGRIADTDIGKTTARRDRQGQFSPPASSSWRGSMRPDPPEPRRDAVGRGPRCDPGRHHDGEPGAQSPPPRRFARIRFGQPSVEKETGDPTGHRAQGQYRHRKKNEGI